MHAEQHHRHTHPGCHESQAGYAQSRGPAWFYGYCHDTGKMRMMDYPDYMNNMQTAYSNLYSGGASVAQPYLDMMQGRVPASGFPSGPNYQRDRGRHGGCGCGCDCGQECHDCHCSCCVRCADVLEYTRCGEVRQIPVTFENETRRERDVKLQLGAFATEGGKELGWHATLSESEFKLPPCGEKTVLVSVTVDCEKLAGRPLDRQVPAPAVHSCVVAYATLSAEGCTICPLVIAVAVLPNDCGAYHAGCGHCCC
ncbi:MAG: hypothetical protein ABSD75_04620 [Terriglobales bacterium]|jgi:hypothetical protein